MDCGKRERGRAGEKADRNGGAGGGVVQQHQSFGEEICNRKPTSTTQTSHTISLSHFTHPEKCTFIQCRSAHRPSFSSVFAQNHHLHFRVANQHNISLSQKYTAQQGRNYYHSLSLSLSLFLQNTIARRPIPLLNTPTNAQRASAHSKNEMIGNVCQPSEQLCADIVSS